MSWFSVFAQFKLYGLWVRFWLQPTLSPVAELQHLHFGGRSVMLHTQIYIYWRNVFRYRGLELDQLRRVTWDECRRFLCEVLGPFWRSVAGSVWSRYHMSSSWSTQDAQPSKALELMMYPSCLMSESAQLESEETGRISGCVGLNEWVVGFWICAVWMAESGYEMSGWV